MSNKINVLTNLDAKLNTVVSGNVFVSGTKELNTDTAFNNISVNTSSDGMYDVDSAIHGLDDGLSTLRQSIKTAYKSVRAVLTGSLDEIGNKKINLTTTIPSGNVYFNTASLTKIEASLLFDTDNDSVYKNDLATLMLYNSSSNLWAEIDAPIAANEPYRLIVANQSYFPLSFMIGGGAAVVGSTLINNLLAYYRFQGNANDELGNYNGSATQYVIYDELYGLMEQGMSTNNLSYTNYVNLNNEIPLANKDWTISFWMKPHDTQNWRALFGKQGDVALYFLNNKFYLENFIAGGGHYFTIQPQTNTWQHVVLTYNKTTKQHNLYVNNVADSSPATNIESFNIKQIAANGASGEAYYGYLDEFAVWDRILTTQEIDKLYNGGNAINYTTVVGAVQNSVIDINGLIAYYDFKNNINDVVGNYNPECYYMQPDNNHGLVPTKIYSPVLDDNYNHGKINNGFVVGSGAYLYFTSSIPLNSGDWSVSLWHKSDSLSPSNYESALFGYDINNFFYVNNSKKVGMIIDGVTSSFSITRTINNWEHIVITYNNTTKNYNLYYNGVLDSTTINNSKTFDISTIAAALIDKNAISYPAAAGYEIGNITNPINASVDEFGVWNKVLNSQEINKLYNSGSGITI